MRDFPLWIIVTHFLNILFMLMMARSGLEILSAFPKLYWIDSCFPGREWLRFSKKVFAADSRKLWSPLVRLRVECQLGFKMVKWIRSIELVSDYRELGQGQGGWREDQQYYTTWAGI